MVKLKVRAGNTDTGAEGQLPFLGPETGRGGRYAVRIIMIFWAFIYGAP